MIKDRGAARDAGAGDRVGLSREVSGSEYENDTRPGRDVEA